MKRIVPLFVLSIIFSGCSPFSATKYQLSANKTFGARDVSQQEEAISILEADTVFYYSSTLFPKLKSSGKVRYGSRLVYIQDLRNKTTIFKKNRISRYTYRSEFSKYPASNSSQFEIYNPSYRTNTPTTGAAIHTGSRGGRYYINSDGNKTYLKKGTFSSGSSQRRTKSYSSKAYTKSISRKSSAGSYKSNSTKTRSSSSKSSYRSSIRR